MSAEPIIYGLIFVGVLVLVEGLYLDAFGKSISLNSRVNRRLEMLDKGGRREEVLDKLRKEMQQHMNAQASRSIRCCRKRRKRPRSPLRPATDDDDGRSGRRGLSGPDHRHRYQRPGARPAVRRHGRRRGVFLGSTKANKRMAMIEEQLPDAVELMVRSLRVGHPFSSAISIVSKEVQIRWRPNSGSSPTKPPMAAIWARRSRTWPNGWTCRICAFWPWP